MSETTVDPNLPVSVEIDGRTLTGMDTTVEALTEAMERRSPEPAKAEPEPTTPEVRDAQTGQFKKTRGQRRFDQFSAAQKTAQEEAAAARAEADTVKRERDDLKARLEAASRPEPAQYALAKDPALADRIVAKAKPTLDEFISEPDPYVALQEAIADWKIEQFKLTFDISAQVRAGIEADRVQRKFSSAVDDARSRGRQTYPDFDAVLKSPHAVQSNWPHDRLQAIARLEAPEHVQYALAKDPTLAERLRTEPDPVKFGMALAGLVTAAAVGTPASTAPTGFTPPPPPHQPVGSGSKTASPSSADLARKGSYDFDKSGYREKRAAERGVRR